MRAINDMTVEHGLPPSSMPMPLCWQDTQGGKPPCMPEQQMKRITVVIHHAALILSRTVDPSELWCGARSWYYPALLEANGC